MDAQGYPESSLGVVLGGSWGSPGALLSAPGLLWGTFWRAWGAYLERFGMIWGTQGGVQSENPPTFRLGVSDLVLGGGLPPPTPSALGPSPPNPRPNRLKDTHS